MLKKEFVEMTRSRSVEEYIADDRVVHELWEEIQSMTDEEREEYIRKFEESKQKKQQ